MSKIEAKIIAGSISPQGIPIATWVATFPRHILAELNTHRMLSRNSASSRAIPFQKMVEKVQTDPFIPIRWMKEHTGMQGTEYITNENEIEYLNNLWLKGRRIAIEQALLLNNTGISKQHVNRVLEPFMWHTAIITATEIENFTALRDDPGTEIHFQELAHQMLTTWNEYEFKPLKAGEWHMPFGDQIDDDRLFQAIGVTKTNGWQPYVTLELLNPLIVERTKIEIATARCARISYGTFEGKDDYEADIKLHDRLAASGHWSPFEHCAQAMSQEEFYGYVRGWTTYQQYDFEQHELGWCGNFKGWTQYRKLFPNENKKDTRVKQHG